ncbi:MAG TPA: kynureninase [Thermomicrobiales bacterium]|nr:kynureninase [Thermomicrobiales bacterium]
MPTLPLTADYARALDDADPLESYRDRFYREPDSIYLDGNSLGLLSRDAERSVLDALESWKEHGVEGWLAADPPWFTLGEALGRRMAPMMGAEPESVVVTGTTTVNLHQLVGTFYRPDGKRHKIIATGLDFPSDVYALQSQVRLRGGDPNRDLVLVESHDGRTIEEDDLIAAITDDVALVMLPSVLYRSGQLLDMRRLTRAAHDAGAIIGFDCAHSAGAIPHELDAWGVDFAFWCSYKYFNAGPGAVGALYVNRRHFGTEPALAGWWGYHKERQFEMAHHWEGAEQAGAWQISTIPLLSAAALLGSLAIFDEAGIEAVREKSLAQTDFLIALIEENGLLDTPYGYRIGTPREDSRRGGHVAVEHEHGAQIAQALRARGIVVDFRQPDVVRLAPVALYTSYHDLWRTVQALLEIVDSGEHERAGESSLVT